VSRARRCLVLAPALLGATALAGQGSDALYTRLNALSGFEVRGFSFDSGLSVSRASQWHIPIAFVTPVGRRLSIDVSASYVGSSLTTSGGTEEITGLTDTQLRLLYTLQRDRLAASLVFNLPTGQRSVSESQFQVTGAVGSNFLSFPVSALGTAFGVTGGLAVATRAGAWNLGLAGSVRYLGSYEPFNDVAATYSPGLEGRVRAGLDRLVGARTRVLVGLTGSTFSADEFSGNGGGLGSGTYTPGPRLIADLGLVHVTGTTTFTLAAWDYYRLAGTSGDTTSTATKENVLNVELRAGLRAGPRVQVTPLVAFRQYNPGGYRGGRLYSGGVTMQLSLSEHVSAQAGGRFDSGWAYVAESGGFANFTGYGASFLVRLQR
jgi:hypothetical protein